MPGTDTVAAAYVQPLLEAAGAHGIDNATLASAAGLPENGLSPLPANLPAAAYVRLLDAGAMLAGEAHFGLHVGERVRMGTCSAYGLVLLNCASVGQALEQTARYEVLAHDLGRWSLRRDGERFQYRWVSHYPHASRHLVDSVFAGIRVCGDWLAGMALPPACARARCAGELAMTPRTLQRKLSDAGTSFQLLLDQVRYRQACDYLRQPELSLADIAFLLGYREQSAFNHAFRAWAGTNPGAWRLQERLDARE